MSVVVVTDQSFSQIIEENSIVLLDFWATWCGPCRAFTPIFEDAADDHPDLFFGKVDTDQQQELSQGFTIRTVPTLMVLRDKIVVVRESGALPASALEQVIAHVRGLDMDQIRAELAAQEKAENSA